MGLKADQRWQKKRSMELKTNQLTGLKLKNRERKKKHNKQNLSYLWDNFQ